MLLLSLLLLLAEAVWCFPSGIIVELTGQRATEAWLVSQGASELDVDSASEMILAEHDEVSHQRGASETRLEQTIAKNASAYISRLRKLRQSGELPEPIPDNFAKSSDAVTTQSPTADVSQQISDQQLFAHACHNKKLRAVILGKSPTIDDAKQFFQRCGGHVEPTFIATFVRSAPAAKAFVDSKTCRYLSEITAPHLPSVFCAEVNAECTGSLTPSAVKGIRPTCVKLIRADAFAGFPNASWFAPDSLSTISTVQAAATPKPTICLTLRPLMVRNNVAAACVPFLPRATAPVFKVKSRMLMEEIAPMNAAPSVTNAPLTAGWTVGGIIVVGVLAGVAAVMYRRSPSSQYASL